MQLSQHVDALGLKQPAHIAGKGRDDVAGPGDKKRGETVHMGAERFGKALQGLNQTRRRVFMESL